MRKLLTTKFGYKVFAEQPTPQELQEHYATVYYQNPYGTYQENYSSEEMLQRRSRIELLEHFININLNVNSNSEKSFLDVGCGEGFVLQHFKDKNWKIAGLDFSTHGVRKNNPSIEEFITQGDIYRSIYDLTNLRVKFSVIFLGNVLEHVLNPDDLVEIIKPLLSENGLFCITVPNDFSKLQKHLLKESLVTSEYWLTYPDHLNYFNLETLGNLLHEKGFDVIDNFCDFPIEWFLTNSNSNYVMDKTKGKAAHNSRVSLDYLINMNENISAKMEFWRSMSNLGFGRTITVLARAK